MIFVTPAELRRLRVHDVDDLLAQRQLVVAAGDGEVNGAGAAVLLFADYSGIEESARLTVDSTEAWAAVVWRIGRRALLLQADAGGVTAADAQKNGLCDALFSGDANSWFDSWRRGRSVAALESAAMLIRHRGGDALERAEFARLFAIGDPQLGLAAFLAKRPPQF